ncbi:hypothetical protein AUG19_06775 [archaeon 13_1_20CM_2_54_9]|nr:MAG: hypothetical protein AUG19_06775 [archaeon 13_1_20CM_2_54_9]
MVGRTAVLDFWPWRTFVAFLLGSSAVGFFIVVADFVSIVDPQVSVYFGNIFVSNDVYLLIAPSFVVLFPVSVGMALLMAGKMSALPLLLLLPMLLLGFVFMVPVMGVQRVYTAPCDGIYTEWQSVSYHFFGIGLHFPRILCFRL